MHPTPKQKKLLDYLTQQIAADGNVPSLRQTAADLGVSHAAVAQMMRTLENKGLMRRDGRYGRNIALLQQPSPRQAIEYGRAVPVVGRVQAGLPLYAQQEWDGQIVVDPVLFRGDGLFALRVRGESMHDAGILADDLVICEPRQYAIDGEIVVALIGGEEATVKRFYLRRDHIELLPANNEFTPQIYDFGEVLIQGRVIGVVRDRITLVDQEPRQ